MGLFSKKIKVANASIYLLPKSGDNKIKANIRIENIPVYNEQKGENMPMLDDGKLSGLLFLYYLDRVLCNTIDGSAIDVLNHFQNLATQYFENIKNHKDNLKEAWEKIRQRLRNSEGIITEKREGLDELVNMDLIFVPDTGGLYLLTRFPSTKDIFSRTYFSLKYFFEYVLDNCDNGFWFLLALLAQCRFYNGKKPGVIQLGKAVEYGINEADVLAD